MISRKLAPILYYLFLFILWGIFSQAAADQNTLPQQLQKMLNTAIASSPDTPGAVLLVSSPTIGTIAVASGIADKITQTPMRTDNNFRLASITKTFLAVTILKMAEQGEINLDDKIVDLLPETMDINRIPNGNKVTVRQLLNMRSGIPNYLEYDAYTDLMKAEPDHHWIPEDGVQMIYDEKPNFEPDKSYEYSNTNYLLLQSIIETVTGNTLSAELRKYIFEPLHLNNTYLEVQEEKPGGFHGLKTHGYELDGKALVDVTTLNDGFGLGDGGIISTAQDLATFVEALLQSKTLLPQDMLKQMLTVKGPDLYGLGIYKEQVNEEWAFTHNGTSSGFVTQFYYFPERKLTLIVLTNSMETDIIDGVASEALTLIDEVTAKQTAYLFPHYTISYFLYNMLGFKTIKTN